MEEEKKKGNGKIIAITAVVTAAVTILFTTYFYGFVIKIVPFGELSENYPKLNAVLQALDQYYYEDFDKQELEEKMLPAVISTLGDPYTAYMNTEEWAEFNESIEGVYDGIGVTIGGKDDDPYINVISTMEGSPAREAGIVSGDRITHVEGEAYFIEGMDTAVSKMRGEAGTTVTITVLHQDETSEDYTLERRSITIETVTSEMWNNVGYLQISSFDVDTYHQFETHLERLLEQGAEGLIIDLRSNGGGLVDTATKIADRLLPEGTIFYTGNKYGKQSTVSSDPSKIDIPYVILVNEGTASASEILSGAVKDHAAGTIVGKNTFGKGLIQMPLNFKDGSAMKITIEKYYTPNGNDIHEKGIAPDVEVDLPEDIIVEARDENDTQYQKALEIILGEIEKTE